MHDVLVDFRYYQGGATFHGGGEYGNVVLEELLGQTEQINCGIFFLKGRNVDLCMLKRCKESGWNVHAICDLRNLSAIVRDYGYKVIYSALPYRGGWSKVNFHRNVRFIGTFHGLRTIELADCESDEKYFGKPGETTHSQCYIFGKEDEEKRLKNKQPYSDALLTFKDCKIIADSEHTKHSIYYHYPELQNADIEVLYSPPKRIQILDGDNDEEILNKEGVMFQNYGLIVSAGIWYKNGKRAMLAYDKVFARQYKFIRSDFKVVVLGVKNKAEMLSDIIHRERFVLLDYVSTEMLEILYRNAQLFVYPSLNEGFGYPPLEAMKYGTLCACSVNTSIAEVCRDMVLYFNPLLIDEIAIRIIESFSENIRAEKRKKIKQQLPDITERQTKDLQRLVNIIIEEA